MWMLILEKSIHLLLSLLLLIITTVLYTPPSTVLDIKTRILHSALPRDCVSAPSTTTGGLWYTNSRPETLKCLVSYGLSPGLQCRNNTWRHPGEQGMLVQAYNPTLRRLKDHKWQASVCHTLRWGRAILQERERERERIREMLKSQTKTPSLARN